MNIKELSRNEFNPKEISHFVDQAWDTSILPTLQEYVHIPCKSPLFDKEWQTNGYIEKALNLLANWCKNQKIPNMKLEVVRLEGRTPVIFIEIPGASTDTVLLYGHLDKQPEMSGWDEDLAPWKAVLKGDKLYGRGAVDDGYAIFASLIAVKALQEQKIPHARCIILIEACEESGSYDLPYYIDALEKRIGSPSLVICLDSGCGNYEQMWMTTSLRGLVSGMLHINVSKHGVHSGMAGGIIPSSFMIARQLLARLEDDKTGTILLKDLQVEIPAARVQQAEQAAKYLKDAVYTSYPFLEGVKPLNTNLVDLILNKTWRAALAITAADGFPALLKGGNVLLPQLTLKISLRIPPTCVPAQAAQVLRETLETNPPFGAHVQFVLEGTGPGWNAPAESAWLTDAANKASRTFFNNDAAYSGEGGSIPFMGMLGEKFPHAQFLITGLVGPGANAHGPNEFLHIPAGKKLTACVASVIADHYLRR